MIDPAIIEDEWEWTDRSTDQPTDRHRRRTRRQTAGQQDSQTDRQTAYRLQPTRQNTWNARLPASKTEDQTDNQSATLNLPANDTKPASQRTRNYNQSQNRSHDQT